MCGIWGMFPTRKGGLTKFDTDLMRQAMIVTALRGDDSTGICAVAEPKGKPKVYKTVGDPYYVLNNDAWAKVEEFIEKKANVVFGHGRSATKGDITVKNAHPFTYKHITLVHNGTINYGLEDEHKEGDTQVDSHALCVAIANKGLVAALEGVYGAYALIVHDSNEGKIHVVRNEERPLNRLILGGKHLIMSEADALRFICNRNNLIGNVAPTIEYFQKHLIYTYDIETAVWTTDDSLQKEYKAKKYVPPAKQETWNPSGTGGSKRSSNVDVYSSVDLLCYEIESTNNGAFKYKFVDNFKAEYHAFTTKNEPERVGEMCRVRNYKRISVGTSYERFVKWREIDWDAHKVVDNDEVLTTVNGIKIVRSAFKKMAEKEDCTLCQGPILAGDCEESIITSSGTLICRDCITSGRHFAFGFGQ